MSRAGIAAGLTGLLVALAVAPASPGQAARAPIGDRTRVVATGTPHEPLLRAPAPKPSVTKMTPQSGTTLGGFDVAIKGRNLSGVKKVLFGATKATELRVKSARKLVVKAPAHEAGVVGVRVVTKHGGSKQSEATHFTYVTPSPSLARLSPRTGPTAGGAPVTISGADLAGATSVRFGSTSAASFHVTSPTTIVATSPARSAGPVNVTVTTAGGSATLDDAYTFVAAPTLASASPSSGPTSGTTVTLTGAGFTSDTVVTFGGSPATGVQVFAGGTQLTLRTPDHAPGWVDVVVTTAGGTATLARGYLFVGGVTLSAVLPPEGPATGGVNVTLTGSGFTADTLVLFGTKPSLDVAVNQAGTQLTALLPAQAPGTVDVVASTEGDSQTLVNAFTYVVAPTLSVVGPDAGPVAGGTSVTLTGTGFRAGMQVSFGGTAATGVTVSSATQATVTAPAHAAGAVNVTVTTPGGSATAANAYTYAVVPTLSVVGPDAGPVAGGTSVTLDGLRLPGRDAGELRWHGRERSHGQLGDPGDRDRPGPWRRCRERLGDHSWRLGDCCVRVHLRRGPDGERRRPGRGSGRGWDVGDSDGLRLPGRDAGELRWHGRDRSHGQLGDPGDRDRPGPCSWCRERLGDHSWRLGDGLQRIRLPRGPDAGLGEPGGRTDGRRNRGDLVGQRLPGRDAGQVRRPTGDRGLGEPGWHPAHGGDTVARGRARECLGDDARRHGHPQRRLHLRGFAGTDRRDSQRGAGERWHDGDADRLRVP